MQAFTCPSQHLQEGGDYFTDEGTEALGAGCLVKVKCSADVRTSTLNCHSVDKATEPPLEVSSQPGSPSDPRSTCYLHPNLASWLLGPSSPLELEHRSDSLHFQALPTVVLPASRASVSSCNQGSVVAVWMGWLALGQPSAVCGAKLAAGRAWNLQVHH